MQIVFCLWSQHLVGRGGAAVAEDGADGGGSIRKDGGRGPREEPGRRGVAGGWGAAEDVGLCRVVEDGAGH